MSAATFAQPEDHKEVANFLAEEKEDKKLELPRFVLNACENVLVSHLSPTLVLFLHLSILILDLTSPQLYSKALLYPLYHLYDPLLQILRLLIVLYLYPFFLPLKEEHSTTRAEAGSNRQILQY